MTPEQYTSIKKAELEELHQENARLKAELAQEIEDGKVRYDALHERYTQVRPVADAYRRVCQALGIESNILGHVEGLETQLSSAREALQCHPTEHADICDVGNAPDAECFCNFKVRKAMWEKAISFIKTTEPKEGTMTPTHMLLIEIAAYLKFASQGLMPAEQAKREAAELLEKIGKLLAEAQL